MAEPKKTLILHIGTHKTGTTSFQMSLRANRGKLLTRGVCPIGVPAKRKKGTLMARRTSYNLGKFTNAFLRPGIASISRVRSGLRPKPKKMADQRARFLTQFRAHREPVLIASSEALTFLRTPEEKERMREFLAALGREVRIVLVFRDEAGWRASWENQLRKNPKVWAKNQELPDAQRANGEWYFDRQAILDFWSDLGELTLIDYNEAMERDHNIIPALYAAMNIDTTGLRLTFESNQRVALDDEDEEDVSDANGAEEVPAPDARTDA